MQSDKMSYPDIVETVMEIFQNTFGQDICLIKCQKSSQRGYITVQYKYIPLQYDVVFESEYNSLFNINICDMEGAKRSLCSISGIRKFDSIPIPSNIQNAVQILKDVLKENKFYFYIVRNDKVYRKDGDKYTRINDLSELYK